MARKKKTTHGVSFPDPELLTAAKAKAASMQISFSTYINQLVRRDLGWKGVHDWVEPQAPLPPSEHRQKSGRFKEPAPIVRRKAHPE